MIKKLYESYATGKLSESRFDMLIADYEREQAEINELIASENERLAAYEEDTGKINDFLALTKKYTDFTQLTPQLIYEFIDRIEVHKPEKVDGERTQEVEIFLKYIGKFEVPLPDPTPEENAEAEKIRRRRANGRERKTSSPAGSGSLKRNRKHLNYLPRGINSIPRGLRIGAKSDVFFVYAVLFPPRRSRGQKEGITI